MLRQVLYRLLNFTGRFSGNQSDGVFRVVADVAAFETQEGTRRHKKGTGTFSLLLNASPANKHKKGTGTFSLQLRQEGDRHFFASVKC